MKMDKRKFTIYIIGAFAIAWVLQIAASYFALKGSLLVFQILLSISMFAPFTATLIAKVPLRGMGWMPKFKGNILYMIAAWFGPAVLTALGAVLYYVVFPDRFDVTGAYLTATYGEELVQQLTAAGLTVPLYAMVAIIQSVTYAPVFNGLIALGEEVGWRGVMYPMLRDKLGKTKGRILGGVIWGVWHWPVMILAGYEYGLSYWGAPFLGMALFCLCTISMGILLDALYEKTKCIWVPAVMHGAFNAAATIPVVFLNPEYTDQMIVGPVPNGILSMIPMFLVVCFLLLKKNKVAGEG